MSATSLRLPDEAPPKILKVGGVTPFSATDYPGQLAAVVFVQGCPWRCDYCHNPHLQARLGHSPLAWQDVIELLQRRIGLIDAVVFSGGEATIDPALQEAIMQVRKLGFKVGLHTAGAYPKRLAEVLPHLDWIGLDIKAPFAHYARITHIADSGEQARGCLEAVLASGIDYECRTTIHPSLLSENDILDMAHTLANMGVQNYALQIFRSQGCGDQKLNAVPTIGYPSVDVVEQVAALFDRFTLRRA